MANQSTSDEEIEWGPPEGELDGYRRGGAVVLTVVLIATAGALFLMTGGASASTDFTANDVAITSNGGTLESLSVAPKGDVYYKGLESEPSAVDVVVEVKKSSGSSWQTLGSKSLSATGLEGNVAYDFSTIDVLSKSSFKRSDFRASDGQTSTTDVDVRVTATLAGAGPNGEDVTTTSEQTFTVAIENIPANGHVGGRANTNGN